MTVRAQLDSNLFLLEHGHASPIMNYSPDSSVGGNNVFFPPPLASARPDALLLEMEHGALQLLTFARLTCMRQPAE